MAGTNDFSCLLRGEGGREINRHNFTEEEIRERISLPFLQRLFELMRFRNTCEAFNGDFSAECPFGEGTLKMCWKKDDLLAELTADFKTKQFTVSVKDKDQCRVI